jgi:hypothetical protein
MEQIVPKVVNLKTTPYDTYIGRGSKWGNPFSSKSNTKAKFKTKSRKESIQKYREWILSNSELLNSIRELKGKRLGCYCKPKSCHGDVLVELFQLKNNELF